MPDKQTKNKKLAYLSLFIATVCLCIPAYINNFPFIYSDTGTYIMLGFTNLVSDIRPLTYGLLLRHISLYESFWIVVFFQAFMTVYFIQLFAKVFFRYATPFVHLLFVALLTATTSIGVTTGMLMPDFTTPIIILTAILILFGKLEDTWIYIYSSLGLWFALACHHSHTYILFLTLLGLVLLRLLFRSRLFNYSWRRFSLLAILMLIGYFTIPSLHYFRIGHFISNHSSNIFLMGRINQMGLLQPFLDEQCPSSNYPICQYKDNIPDAFLWDVDSPVGKDGGWRANNERYRQVIQDFFIKPYYVKKFIIKSLETGVQQLFTFNTVKLHALERGRWPQYMFERHMPDVVPALEKSRQNRLTWSSAYIDFVQSIVIFSSALFLIYLFFFQDQYAISLLHQKVLVLIVLFLLSNAFFCGGVSMIAPRFQARVIWVLPLFTLYLSHHIWMVNRMAFIQTDASKSATKNDIGTS